MAYVIGFILLFCSWMQPLHLLPWVSWHNEVFAYLAVLLLAVTILNSQRNNFSPFVRMPTVAFVFVALLFLVAGQTAVGSIEFMGDGVVLGFSTIICILAMIVGFEVGLQLQMNNVISLGKNNKLFIYALVIVGAGVCSVCLCLVQSFDVWESAGWVVRIPRLRRPGANFGQPNHLATLLLMGISSLGYLYESRKVSATFASILVVFLILGVALTESRTGLLSFMLLAVWWLVFRRSLSLKTSTFFVLAGSIVLIFLLWAWPQFLAYVQSGGVSGGNVVQVDTSTGTRLIVWPQLIETVFQKPWLGWGLREVSEAHNAVLHKYTVSEPFTYAHNIILDMAVGMGLPLAIIFLVIVAIWLWRRIRATKALVPWYCFALILPFGVHSMLEYPFAYAYFLVPVMFAVGVLEGTLAPNSLVRIGWWPAAIGLFLVSTIMFWSVAEYIVIEEDFRVARFEALHVGKTPVDYERPKIYLLTQLDALLEGTRIEPVPGMTPQRIELSRKVAMRYPWTAIQNRYALSLALNGNTEEAIRQLKVMRVMHGEKTYEGIKARWEELGDTRFPQLKSLTIP